MTAPHEWRYAATDHEWRLFVHGRNEHIYAIGSYRQPNVRETRLILERLRRFWPQLLDAGRMAA